jgi:hypothetical protein
MITPEILKEFMDRFGERIFQACIAEIDSYDKTSGTAKVIPLLKIQRESDVVKFPVLSKVPVLNFQAGNIRLIHDYKKGDLVWLAFSSFELSNALKGQFEFTNDKFAFENCIIIGGLSRQPSALNPLVQKDGLVITDNSSMVCQFSESKIELKLGSNKVTIESSKITLEGDVVVKGKLDVDQDISWNNSTVKTTASTHTHGTGVGPSSSPTAGS